MSNEIIAQQFLNANRFNFYPALMSFNPLNCLHLMDIVPKIVLLFQKQHSNFNVHKS
jgi:hypothetical protein